MGVDNSNPVTHPGKFVAIAGVCPIISLTSLRIMVPLGDEHLYRGPTMPEPPVHPAAPPTPDAPLHLRDPEDDSRSSAPARPTETAGPPADHAPELPALVGRYEILEEIAHGGMGAVFKVRDPDLGRTLALKILLDCHKDRPDLQRRFLEEAQIGGQLQHPGLVPVHELGHLPDRRPFFTMKLVKGRTLADHLKERASPAVDLPRLLTIFEQVCQTVAYAHSRGVIHRDLKPANVMVGSFGEVQVMDWGLAKLLGQPPAPQPAGGVGASTIYSSRASDTDESATRAGTVLGTPAYMPPEQARGQVDHLDERCDVFGLGAVLCEILTGQPPYCGTREQVVAAATQGDLDDACARLERCGADAELVRLAQQCLAFKPLDRPANADAVARALTAHRTGVETRLRQAEVDRAAATARAAEERKRRKLTLVLAGWVLLSVLFGGGGLLWVNHYQALVDHEALIKENERDRLAREDKARRDHDALVEKTARDQKDREAKERHDRETQERRAETTRHLQKVLARAEDQRAKARQTNDAARWAEARTLAEQAEGLLAELPGDQDLAERVRVLRQELQDEEKDRVLLVRLEQLWRDRFVSDYAAAFGDHGFLGLTEQEQVAWVRRRPAATRERLIAGLDAWLLALPAKAPARAGLFQVIQAADDNVPRKELRAAIASNDLKAVEHLANAEALRQQHGPETLLLLADYLRYRTLHRAIAVLHSAQERFPGDYWIVSTLADLVENKNIYDLADESSYEEEVRYRTAALALRPDSIDAQVRLGHALAARGKFNEALAVLSRGVAQQPNDPQPWVALAWAYGEQGQAKEAEAAIRHALKLGSRAANNVLSLILADQGRYDEAAAAVRRSIRYFPMPSNHVGLAAILWRKGRHHEAATELRKALDLQDDYVAAKFFLDLFRLLEEGQAAKADGLCRTIIAFKPKNPYGYFASYICLATQGRFAETLPVIKRCVELAAVTPNVRRVPIQALREIEQVLALEPKLPAFLKGDLKPKDAAERELLLYLCWAKKQYAGAAKLYADAFAADPKLAEDLQAEHRCDAARNAARAGAGLGDGAALDEKERGRWRRQALEWLRADLAARTRQLQADDPDERAAGRERLLWWQQDPDLPVVRDAKLQEQLPADERAACQKFWAEVAWVLKQKPG
jgi:serine/threonine-protein kinase